MAHNFLQTAEEYLEGFQEDMREILQQTRKLVLRAAPMTVEQVSKGMLTYFFHGEVVKFTGQGRYVRFVASPAAIRRFQKELVPYRTERRDTVQFFIYEPLPEELVRKMTVFRIQENSDQLLIESFGRTF